MNTRGLLDQLLKSGQQMLQDKTAGAKGKSGGGLGDLGGCCPALAVVRWRPALSAC